MRADAYQAQLLRERNRCVRRRNRNQMEGSEPMSAPTATPKDACREAFEKWFGNDGQDAAALKRYGDGYHLITADSAWIAWLAAWAARPTPGPVVPEGLRDILA